MVTSCSKPIIRAIIKRCEGSASKAKHRAPKLGHVDRDTKVKVVGMHLAGSNASEIARALGMHPSTAGRIVKKHAATGSVDRKRGTGRSRKTTAADDTYLRILAKRHRKKSAGEIRKLAGLNKVSDRTARRRIKEVTG